MNIQKAAKTTMAEIESRVDLSELSANPKQNQDSPCSWDHVLWMLDGIAEGYIQHEKGHRWLGWAQAVVCSKNVLDLNQLKQINKDS